MLLTTTYGLGCLGPSQRTDTCPAIRRSGFGRCAGSDPGTADVSQMRHHSAPMPSRHIRKSTVFPTLLNYHGGIDWALFPSANSINHFNKRPPFPGVGYVGSTIPLINVVALSYYSATQRQYSAKASLGLLVLYRSCLPGSLMTKTSKKRALQLTFYKDAECLF